MTLWFRQPAGRWLEALPIGNGRMGAMVFGAAERDRVQLNEDSLWSGGPRDCNNPEALKHLPELREALFNDEFARAHRISENYMLGDPSTVRPYQTLGDLWLDFPGHDQVTDYHRELNLETGVVRVSYRIGQTGYRREYFASSPDQVLVVHLTSDRPGTISTRVSISREADARAHVLSDRSLALKGRCDEGKGIQFEARVLAQAEGGSVTAREDQLEVAEADSLTLLLAASTSYREKDPGARCEEVLRAAAQKPIHDLRETSVADHAKYFGRVVFELAGSSNDQPTDQRLEAFKNGRDDPLLAVQFFQVGRYLLISCSRPGSLPANLQGLWNHKLRPPWNSDYHFNINLPMNYWPAEVTNLADCAEPLFKYIDSLREPGRETARVHYGCGGFVFHHLSDVWGFTAPADGLWGLWPMGAGWMCQHFWEHYAFSLDRVFLARDAYPIMKEAAEFLLDFLIEDEQGRLVSSPSTSPEHTFRAPNGQIGYVAMNSVMDLQIIHDLFTHCIEASEILDVDPGFRERLRSALKRLPELEVDNEGRLVEWLGGLVGREPGHRHLSHLFAVYPGNQITLRSTPSLVQAARKALEHRLDNGSGRVGWSRAWMISLWARLEEGDHAHESLSSLLNHWTCTNLLGIHPPDILLVDCSLGGVAGIAEMLCQSHAGEVSLLPALPEAWPSGSITGLRARGGFEVSIGWRAGQLTSATILSTQGGPCRVRVPGDSPLLVNEGAVEAHQAEAGVFEFDTQPGRRYVLAPRG